MLNRLVGKAAGVSITYTRGATTLTILDTDGAAWVGRTAFVSNQNGAARVEWGDRDYLILASALAGLPAAACIDETPVAIGDRITEVVEGASLTFEVMTPGTGEPAARFSDPTRTVVRLHCKQV